MAREPQTPHRIAGVKEVVFSEADRKHFEELAERDDWAQARNAYAPNHRPVIRQQLNPIIVHAQWVKQQAALHGTNPAATAADDVPIPQELPEFWAVKVPRTVYAFNSTELVADRLYRDQPGQKSAKRGPNEEERLSPQHSQATLTAAMARAKADWQLKVFPSADEAERFAQETWRTYWAQHVKHMTEASRKQFQQNAVINVIRERVFTVDLARPAHQLQYEIFLNQHPDGLPSGALVDFKDSARPRPTPGATPKLGVTPHEEPAAGFEFHTEKERLDWELTRSKTATDPDEEPAWEIHPIGDKEFVLARPTPTNQWEFWANATGRPVAFEAKTAQAVLRSLPTGVAATTQPTRYVDPDALRDRWIMARDHGYGKALSEPLANWMAAEMEVGRQLAHLAKQSPLLSRQVLPLLQRVDTIDQQIFAADGIVPNRMDETMQALDYLRAASIRALPLNARPGVIQAIDHWRTTTGPLNADSLGLFRYDRVPDIGFADARIESIAHVDGLGDWIAHQMPSGHFALGRLKEDGSVSHVEIPLYRDKMAVHNRVAGQGGYLTFAQSVSIEQEWVHRTELAFGAQAGHILHAAFTPNAVWREHMAREKQQADPTPLPPITEAPRSWNLSVTPMGNGRGLVWHAVDDPERKEHTAELVGWRKGALTALNKHARGWRLPSGDGTVPDWNALAESERPWVVECGPQGTVRDLVEAVRQEMPNARVTAEPLTDPHIVEALAQRWGFQPAPLRMAEAIWMVHPVPENPDRLMLSTREWVTDPKVDHPGEFIAHAAFKPYRDYQAPLGPDGYPPVVQFRTTPATLIQTLEKAGWVGRVSRGIPPEAVQIVTDRQSWDPPAIDWQNRDPLVVLQRASRDLATIAQHDLGLALKEAAVPAPQRKMMYQIFAGSRAETPLKADTWEAIQPMAAVQANLTWQEAEASVRKFAATWLEEHPKIAKRLLTKQAETPTVVRTPAPVSALSI